MPNMIRTNFYFPKQMLVRLRVAANTEGLPVSEVIRRAVSLYLKKAGL